MQWFIRSFAIAFGITCGVGAAILLGRFIIDEAQKGGQARQAQQEAAANQQQAAANATSVARQVAQLTATAAVARCDDPQKVMVKVDIVPNSGGPYDPASKATGTARNTCNYNISGSLTITLLGSNGAILDTTKVLLSLSAGQEQPFVSPAIYRRKSDIASASVTPSFSQSFLP